MNTKRKTLSLIHIFYDLLYDRSAERLVLEPQYLLYGAGEGFFERFIPYDGFEALLSPGVFDVFHVCLLYTSIISQKALFCNFQRQFQKTIFKLGFKISLIRK